MRLIVVYSLRFGHQRNIIFFRTKLDQKEAKGMGSVLKKRRKKMRKHKHKKLLARMRHKRK